MTISVLLVGDHEIVRNKLQAMLEGCPDLELISETGIGAARRTLRRRKVDVIVLDTQKPTLNSIRSAQSLIIDADDTPVILLSLHTDVRYVKTSFGSGIAGYLLRESAYEELPGAIRVVADGNCYLSPPIARAMSDRFASLKCPLNKA